MTDSQTDSPQTPAFLKAWDDYTAACQSLFERLGDPSATVSGPAPPAFFGHWQEFAKNLGMRPDLAAGGQFKPQDMFAGNIPALGLTREYQEIAQRMVDLSTQFQRRYAEFMQQGADIGQSAMQKVQKLNAGNASAPSSPAAIYDAWIDSAEEAYSQAAHGESFARMLAELCNLLSAFKIERGKLLEAFARHLDLPSRAEVDSLHRQVRDLKNAARETSAKAGETNAKTMRVSKPTARKPRKRAGK